MAQPVAEGNALNYSRRQLLGAGAAAGLIATAAKGETLAHIVLNDRPRAPMPRAASAVVPARPRVLVDPVIDPRLLARARAAFDANRGRIRHTDLVAITDFSRASREQRFFILDTNTGKVSSHYVAHGRGSDPDHSGFLERFSNAFGSNATSAGGYITGEYYNGKYGRSMKVKGLEPRNNNAESRAIVVHSAWYAEPEVIREHGKLGRSEGCFALSHASLQEVLQRLGPGHFLYADKLA
jgi:hypothetical protein